MSQTFVPDRRFVLLSATGLAATGLAAATLAAWEPAAAAADPYAAAPVRQLTPAQWRAKLPPASFAVLRQEGTEAPYSSPLNDEHRRGAFVCLGCDLPLFRSPWKFDSHTGWPSFFTAIGGALARKTDLKIGIPRTEYHCARCLGHQGHVFDDGPPPTGLRYCNNGATLRFVPA